MFAIANPLGLPPATGYFSFETPLTTGKGELTRSELETSRVWSLPRAVALHHLHTVGLLNLNLKMSRFLQDSLHVKDLRIRLPPKTSPCHGLLLLRDSPYHW